MGLAASGPLLGYPSLADQYGWYKVLTETPSPIQRNVTMRTKAVTEIPLRLSSICHLWCVS
jgi:hypothetical protein